MILTDKEKKMLSGDFGPVIAKALDYIVQFGEAFGAKKLIDVSYVHYPAEMAIYKGSVEEVVEFSRTCPRVIVPTTTSTLSCDLKLKTILGCPRGLYEKQMKATIAHGRMGLIGTYTCTPQQCGFLPPKGSYIVSVESSAIVYFNSVLGARTNRGGFLTRYSAITGKYPLMGYLLDENRRGTHLFIVNLVKYPLNDDSEYSALGFHVGEIVGSEVPVFDNIGTPRQSSMIALGAALATSGSVTLFHAPPHTAEANTIEDAFMGGRPKEVHEVTDDDIDAAFRKLTNIPDGSAIDFVTLGCPHYNLAQLQRVAHWLYDRQVKINRRVRFWVCTNRMTRKVAEYEGVVTAIEAAGGFVVCDTCPVESHMRISTCRDYHCKIPNVDAMVTDSAKMARYAGDLIGCRTALTSFDKCMRAAVEGRLV